MVFVAVPVGLLIGILLGALGGGGSILTVPALVYLLSQPTSAAITGSLIIVGITALTGMAAHLRAGHVRVGQGVTFGLIGAGGSWLGARLSIHADPHVLLTAFAALLLVASVVMLRRSQSLAGASHQGPPRQTASWSHQSGSAASAPRPRPAPRRTVRVILAASLVGLITGFFGVGGGFVIVPALVLALDFDMQAAVGTSLLVIAINAATGLLARAGTHVQLDWPLLTAFLVAAAAGSLAGNRIVARADARKLTLAFCALLVLVSIYTAARSIPHLA